MKRDIIITTLLTFCLTATLFMVATTKSQEYDPWADLNEDGKIDILDIVGLTSIYGTTGDSAKNVTVTNWPTNNLAYSTVASVSASSVFYTQWIPLDGYSKISICFTCDAVDNYFAVQTRHSGGPQVFYVETQFDLYGYFIKTYDVPNEEMRVYFINYDASAVDLRCDFYLIP